MTIEQQRLDDTLYVKVIGKLDTNTSPSLEKFLSENFLNVSIVVIHNLVLDLSEVPYISSAGLRVVIQTFKLTAAKADKGLTFSIHKPSDFCMQVFETIGATAFLQSTK